jgi:glycerol-3-phosphate cytidylyltransferase
MTYCFDIDGTICTMEADHNYNNATPFKDVVDEIKRLHENGHRIVLCTARGNGSGINWTDVTLKQMHEWGVPYDQISIGEKVGADYYIDDKAINIVDWRKQIKKKVGFIAGAFDVIHAGYIEMFEDAKNACDHLIVGLQSDPTLDRPHKMKPVQSEEDRRTILESITYIDEVINYSTEEDLYRLLQNLNPDVRIIGSDYKDRQFTGRNLDIEVYFHKREHSRSTTKLKERIAESCKKNA